MNDTFSFSDKQQVDSSYPLLKNGEPTICPKTQPFGMESPIQPGHIVFTRLSCNNKCPFLQNATRTAKDMPNFTEKGLVITCGEKPIFLKLDEKNESQLIATSPLKLL
jgi:hypothetical protein